MPGKATLKNRDMKRALVTGGSGAIGAAICRRLAADGYYVYVHAHSRVHEADDLAKEIRAQGSAAGTVVFDVTQREGAATT